MKRIFTGVVVMMLAAVMHQAVAQINTPAASPFSKVIQEVGLTEITLEYSRPSARGRKVFGDLLPYGVQWRTGANQPTTISFNKAVTIAGKELAAGSYVVTSIPGKDEWSVSFSQDNQEMASAKVKPVAYPVQVETLSLQFANLTDNSAEFQILWEKTLVPVTITVNTDQQVMAQIDRFAANPEASVAGNYYQAASYYLSTNRDLGKALEWVNKAIAANPDFFWQYRTKALILAGLGKYNEAIAAAETSTEKAKAANNADYPRMNEKSIAEWKSKK